LKLTTLNLSDDTILYILSFKKLGEMYFFTFTPKTVGRLFGYMAKFAYTPKSKLNFDLDDLKAISDFITPLILKKKAWTVLD